MSRNSQVGGRAQVSFGTAWNADGYASAGKASGSYQGVGQQSGLFAGNGGYHIDAGHVNLVGGAIASTNAGNSELTADALTFTDLQNHMEYTASSGSISGGAGGEMDGWAPKPETAAPRGCPGLPMMKKGSDSSSTLATLTEGNITIGGKQTSAAELGINTDVSGAHCATLEGQDLADFQALDAEGKQNYVLSHSADYRNFYRSQLQWGSVGTTAGLSRFGRRHYGSYWRRVRSGRQPNCGQCACSLRGAVDRRRIRHRPW
ncbi:hypothetical protein [Stenotrophomonas maltophilia]|uniref:hypothetical protein n=1 Tax=Stenotrophomonas maltophilia TaxID=40324 RepID=UPI003BF8495B